MISVLILTRNEEHDLPGCLASVQWCDDIHVFDSCSDDATVTLAAAGGARVTQRAFDNYAAQRNAALHGLEFKHAWVLTVDADERIPAPLVSEMHAFTTAAQSDVVAARIRRRDFFDGRWLKHAQLSPFFIRLVRPDRVRYEREVNEVLRCDGVVHDLAEPFDHFPFSKGMTHWLEKHNRYSTMEAERAIAERGGAVKFSIRAALFSRNFNDRRFHQKGLFYRLPGRPMLKFFYMLAWRRAFLDGWPGVRYAVLQSIYEYFIVLKERELRLTAK